MPDSSSSREKPRVVPIVLVVDDERQAHAMLPRILSSAGVVENIVHAYNGEEAIRYLDNQMTAGPGVPFLIVLDLEMPGKNGLDVMRWLHERQLSTLAVVIVVTASQSMENRQEALRLGAYAVMDKFPRAAEILGAYVSARARLPKPKTTGWLQSGASLISA